MAKEREEKKALASRLFEQAQASSKKQTNKSQKHIKFEVGDLLWLKIKDFNMLETLANKFIPKYVNLYKIICNPTLMCILCNFQCVSDPPDLPCVPN